MRVQRPAIRPARAAFSLVEILIVISILGILAALLLPAINSARRTARVAEVQSEFESIKASITAFNTRFKKDPPSYIQIYEAPADWAADALSRRKVKELWPQFDFTLARDINGDSDSTDDFELEGSECLVFFLGGMVDSTSGAFRGFSKNPSNPLVVDNGQRDGPFYEFEGGLNPSTRQPTGRLIDTDADSLPEYVDSLPSQTLPIIYFSSYDGAGYRPADDDSIGPYYRDAARKQAYNSDGFQLISPGLDGEYGVGGVLDSEDANGNGSLDTGEDSNGNGTLDTSRTLCPVRITCRRDRQHHKLPDRSTR